MMMMMVGLLTITTTDAVKFTTFNCAQPTSTRILETQTACNGGRDVRRHAPSTVQIVQAENVFTVCGYRYK